MRTKLVATVLGIVLLLSTPLSLLSGCSRLNAVCADFDAEKSYAAAMDFAVNLFKQSVSIDTNSLISPISILCALAMTANGADGNTRAQMEEVLGLSVGELNAYLCYYMNSIAADNETTFSIANSIWFKDMECFDVEREFLQLNADYYGADIYKAPFDNNTLHDINDWVRGKTRDMVDGILDEISRDDVMYLINAIAFEAEWQKLYENDQVRDRHFTALSGSQRNVEMMYSDEQVYLDDGRATGFVKYYAGGRYAFAALLPNEGLAIGEYIATLTGQGLADTLRSAQNTLVYAAIPKFESECKLVMNEALQAMGVRDAFDQYLANFQKLSSRTETYISSVTHKTFISVDAKGTRAAAAAIVIMAPKAAQIAQRVYLDRPFVYMLLDCETNTPFFIGTVMDITA